MIVAAAPPLLAIVFALGALGWLGFRLNMFLNVMTPLIMVISFSDSMQLTFAARDQLMAGKDKRTAFRNAILIVGPACVLTHAAAGLSLLGLLTSSSDLIRGFGAAGFIATVIALMTVLSLVPVLGVLMVRNEAALRGDLESRRHGRGRPPPLLRLDRPRAWSAVRAFLAFWISWSSRASRSSIPGLSRSYRLADQVPDREQAVAASGRLDAKMTRLEPDPSADHIPSGRGPL